MRVCLSGLLIFFDTISFSSATTTTEAVSTAIHTTIEAFEPSPEACCDTDNGSIDEYGDGCATYQLGWCGFGDDDDFSSNSMCCLCGGGSIGNCTIEATSTSIPTTTEATTTTTTEAITEAYKYNNLGTGLCQDDSGKDPKYYFQLGYMLNQCEEYCTAEPTCLGYSYVVGGQWDTDCIIYTNDTEAPSGWTFGTGSGSSNIAGVLDVGFNMSCMQRIQLTCEAYSCPVGYRNVNPASTVYAQSDCCKASIYYNNVGIGMCQDESGTDLNYYFQLGYMLNQCEAYCTAEPTCLGYSYIVGGQWDTDCIIYTTDTKAPSGWTFGLGSGSSSIAGVLDIGQNLSCMERRIQAIYYNNLGMGMCQDELGQNPSYYFQLGFTPYECEGYCTAEPTCLGFSYIAGGQWDTDCIVYTTDTVAPSGWTFSPGSGSSSLAGTLNVGFNMSCMQASLYYNNVGKGMCQDELGQDPNYYFQLGFTPNQCEEYCTAEPTCLGYTYIVGGPWDTDCMIFTTDVGAPSGWTFSPGSGSSSIAGALDIGQNASCMQRVQADSPTTTTTSTTLRPTLTSDGKAPMRWFISAGDGYKSCETVCGEVGGSCIQAALDGLALSPDNMKPSSLKEAYEGAIGMSKSCAGSLWMMGCVHDSCVDWGLPFIHSAHLSSARCWGGDAVAPCSQKPVDTYHRRLCPCQAVQAVEWRGWAIEYSGEDIDCRYVMNLPPTNSLGGCKNSECPDLGACMAKCEACFACQAIQYHADGIDGIRCHLQGSAVATWCDKSNSTMWQSNSLLNNRSTSCQASTTTATTSSATVTIAPTSTDIISPSSGTVTNVPTSTNIGTPSSTSTDLKASTTLGIATTTGLRSPLSTSTDIKASTELSIATTTDLMGIATTTGLTSPLSTSTDIKASTELSIATTTDLTSTSSATATIAPAPTSTAFISSSSAAAVTTSTTGAVRAGTKTLKLADVSGLSVGMSLTIFGVGHSETKTIVSVDPNSLRRLSSRRLRVPGTVIVDGEFENSYAQGTRVVANPKADKFIVQATTIEDVTQEEGGLGIIIAVILASIGIVLLLLCSFWFWHRRSTGVLQRNQTERLDQTERSVQQLRDFIYQQLANGREIKCRCSEDVNTIMDVAAEIDRGSNDMVYFFVSRKNMLDFDTSKPMPSFQDLRETGQLSAHHITMSNAENGKYEKSFVAISHRWREPHHPDEDGAQLLAVQIRLRECPQIEWVWLDWMCMPQKIKRSDGTTTEKSPVEQNYFGAALQNVNILYLFMECFILLDMQYTCRFWCLLEAYLGTHTLADKRLAFSQDDRIRHHFIKMYTTNDHLVESLKEIVNKSEKEMLETLKNDDIVVTNKSDKAKMILKMHAWLREKGAFSSEDSPRSGGNERASPTTTADMLIDPANDDEEADSREEEEPVATLHPQQVLVTL